MNYLFIAITPLPPNTHVPHDPANQQHSPTPYLGSLPPFTSGPFLTSLFPCAFFIIPVTVTNLVLSLLTGPRESSEDQVKLGVAQGKAGRLGRVWWAAGEGKVKYIRAGQVFVGEVKVVGGRHESRVFVGAGGRLWSRIGSGRIMVE